MSTPQTTLLPEIPDSEFANCVWFVLPRQSFNDVLLSYAIKDVPAHKHLSSIDGYHGANGGCHCNRPTLLTAHCVLEIHWLPSQRPVTGVGLTLRYPVIHQLSGWGSHDQTEHVDKVCRWSRLFKREGLGDCSQRDNRDHRLLSY